MWYYFDMNFFTKPIIIGVLAMVFASGGVYGKYRVIEYDAMYGADFENRTHEVLDIVDGDTFIVAGAEGAENVRVRLLGIDAPELGRCYGEEAKKELARLIAGRSVVLVKDESGDDGYGRLLRYALVRSESPELDDTLVTVELARRGAVKAQYVRPNKLYNARVSAAEAEAIDNERGLWAKCDYKSERETRRDDREVASETFAKECVIKGNTGRWGKTYLLPGCPNYKRSKVDTSRGERWFCSESEAQKAGWKRSKACGNLKGAK